MSLQAGGYETSSSPYNRIRNGPVTHNYSAQLRDQVCIAFDCRYSTVSRLDRKKLI